MIAVIQRVSHASVEAGGKQISRIGPGLLILLGVSADDGPSEAAWLAGKISRLRIFSDAEGKMNLSVLDLGLEAMVVSQFTLFGDASQGNRPSYTQAARPEKAIPFYEDFCRQLESCLGREVKKGIFGADMKISLLNDGPVTLMLDTQAIMKKV
jgi:D-tyrosyl-tRNA(Tyr) deacylase